MSNNTSTVDEIFAGGIKDSPQPYDSASWNEMSELLDAHMPVTSPNNIPSNQSWWKAIGGNMLNAVVLGVAVTALIVSGYVFFSRNKTGQNQSLAKSEKIKSSDQMESAAHAAAGNAKTKNPGIISSADVISTKDNVNDIINAGQSKTNALSGTRNSLSTRRDKKYLFTSGNRIAGNNRINKFSSRVPDNNETKSGGFLNSNAGLNSAFSSSDRSEIYLLASPKHLASFEVSERNPSGSIKGNFKKRPDHSSGKLIEGGIHLAMSGQKVGFGEGITYLGGVNGTLNLLKNVSVSVEALYAPYNVNLFAASTSQVYGTGMVMNHEEVTITRLHYLSFPVIANYWLDSRWSAGVGFVYGYLMSTNYSHVAYTTNTDSGFQTQFQSFNGIANRKSIYNRGLRKSDAAILAQVSWLLGRGFTANARYVYGLNDVTRNDYAPAYSAFDRRSSFQIGLSYRVF